MHPLVTLLGVAALTAFASAQYPAAPVGITTLQSMLHPGVSIDYKESNICETTPGVRSYSGYVHIPASHLQDVSGEFNMSTFFWYFEARNNPSTAPLSIYLAGGPGESSAYSVLSSESGPCYTNPDGKSTTLNPWSFNNHVNMLYIDQPVQSGWIYDSLINGTYDLLTGAITPMTGKQLAGVKTNSTFGIGTYASQKPTGTTNNTVASAKALWHFAENWLSSFPEYRTSSNKISLWTNSYGGYWGPATVAYFQKQLASTPSSSPLHKLTMDTLGMTNACVDLLIQMPYYAQFAYNNTYGVEFIPEAEYNSAVNNFTKPGGCSDLILQCRELGQVGDPNWNGNNATVNEACAIATNFCVGYALPGFDRSAFDVATVLPDTCPYYLPVQTYLNQAPVLAALGVPVNFTYDSNIVTADYSLSFDKLGFGTGDSFRKSISDLNTVLQSGVKVAMVYGDRDYRCPWLGAEAVANAALWVEQGAFQKAGYERFVTNVTYHGGVTKQAGDLSFTRVFQAGHAVSAAQPETVYRVFMRSLFGRNIATGMVPGAGYKSKGPVSSWDWREVLPKVPATCLVEGTWLNQSIPWVLGA